MEINRRNENGQVKNVRDQIILSLFSSSIEFELTRYKTGEDSRRWNIAGADLHGNMRKNTV